MNLLLPLFLGATALIGLPILLHLLRRKPTVTVIFPTLQFLGPAAVRETRRHRLRRWLTLLLRCLIILLICLAFSRPFWRFNDGGHGSAVVIAVDNSFSMQTGDRWKKLRDWASTQLASLGADDQAGILLMNPAPRWLVPLSNNIDGARETLAALQPGYETTRYDPALRLAGDALAQSGAANQTLVWMADEQQTGWQAVSFSTPLPADVKFVTPPTVDPPARQAAIVKTSWNNSGAGPVLHVELRAFTPAQDTRQITVSADGNVLAKQSVTLTAGQPTSLDIPLAAPSAEKVQGIKVALDPDDLPADDVSYLMHDPDDSTRIYLTPAGGDNFDFLRHALDSTRQVEGAALKADALPDAPWPVNSVVLVRGDSPFLPPMASRLDAFLQAGGVAWLFLTGSPAQTDWMKQHHIDLKPVAQTGDEPLHLRNWDTGHPALAPLAEGSLIGLLNIEFYRGVALGGLDATPLATWENGDAAIAEVDSGGIRFLACGFEPEREFTDWTTQASFVPFVHAALVWLSRQQHGGNDWRVGDAIALPGDGTWKCLDGPGLKSETQASGSVRPQAPGLYQFTINGQNRLFAVNLKGEESDPALWPTPNDFQSLTRPGQTARPKIATASTVLSREEAENRQRVWWWLLALAVILILAELRLANRTSM